MKTNILTQYKGLRKENYILFLGRVVTNLGSMIWPMLTLILNQKMGMNATGVALITIMAGLLFLPAGMLGGHIADKYNKKNCIIVCDIISIVLYVVCAFIPLSYLTIGLLIVAATCQSMEHPAYNALVADITKSEDREKAYSLQYLGINLGLVASPTIAGFLFAHYLWLAFLISGFAISVSTVLIFFKVKNIKPVEESEENQTYQKRQDGESLFSVLRDNKVLLLYIAVAGLYEAAYQQYGYLMPLDMGRLHGENGAMIFGSVASMNCIIVVIFTPIFTSIFAWLSHTKKTLAGQILLLAGYAVFLLMRGKIPAYYVAILLFTFGEILATIARGPYLVARIPASHRGRINGFQVVVQNVMQGACMLVSGRVYDGIGSTGAWIFVITVAVLSIAGGISLVICDKKKYGTC